MTKRISPANTVVVPIVEAHVAEGKAVAAKAAVVPAEVEAGAAKADVVVEQTAEAAANEPIVALVTPAPLAMVVEPVAAAATQDTTATTTSADTSTDGDTDYTPYIVGGVLLAGGIAAIALSGGDDDDNTPPPPPPPPANTAPTFTAATATATVAENTAATTTVFTAAATDAQGNAITYTLGGTDAALFNINATSGVVTLRTPANFEAKASYSFTVTATDNASPALSSTQTVTLNVTNVNEAPSFATATTTVSVAENIPTTQTVLTAAATDPDANTTLTYSLTGTDAAAFAINATTGVVTFRASPDFETKATYSFNVVASDAATNGLTATQAVTVNVTDVAEGPVGTRIDGAGIPANESRSYDAANGNQTFLESGAAGNVSVINNFTSGDIISTDAASSSYSFSSDGTTLNISFNNNGVLSQIALPNAVSATAFVFNEASAEAAVGFDFFRSTVAPPPPAPAGTVALGNDTYNAATTATTFTENATTPNTSVITNFGLDDKIVVSGATAGAYSFTSVGNASGNADLVITFANNGQLNSITINNVVKGDFFVFNEATAEQGVAQFFSPGTGGSFDFFQYA